MPTFDATMDSDRSSNSSTPNTSYDELRAPNPEFAKDGIGSLSVALSRVRNICCVGAGYVGGPTAAVTAFQNPQIRVTVVDRDVSRIQAWKSRHLPVHEPGLADIVRITRDGTKSTEVLLKPETGIKVSLLAREPNLFFSTEVAHAIAEADIVFLSVNTPTKVSGIGAGSATNLASLEGAMTSIAKAAKPGAIIVEKSTVPCGTSTTIRNILTIHRPGVPFEILSNPEFLAEGSAVKDLLNPDRILIGSSRTSSGLSAAMTLKAVYSTWIDPAKIVLANLWSSELAKLVANAMLAQRISSINSISAICDQTGADIDEVAYAVGLDKRVGGNFLKAGLGFGGSCFKKDILSLVYLSRSLHLPEVGDYWMSVLKINEYQQSRFVGKVVHRLNGALFGKKITVLGYAFKENTNDTRESPAIEAIKTLITEQPSEIAIFDPGCYPEDIEKELSTLLPPSTSATASSRQMVHAYADPYEACQNSSAILILTPWKQFCYPAAMEIGPPFTENEPKTNVDVVSFLKDGLSEMEILALSRYKRSQMDRLQAETVPQFIDLSDPLGRMVELPTCAVGCRHCDIDHTKDTKTVGNVNWALISSFMQEPKWVFDGRNVVNPAEMNDLGFRVESMGKAKQNGKFL